MTEPKKSAGQRRAEEQLEFERANADRLIWLLERMRDDINTVLEDISRYRRRRRTYAKDRSDEEAMQQMRARDDSDES